MIYLILKTTGGTYYYLQLSQYIQQNLVKNLRE